MTEVTRDYMASRLASLFLAAAKDGTNRIRALDWPLTIPKTQLSIMREQGNVDSWSSVTSTVQKNVLSAHADMPIYQLAPLLTDEVAQSALENAAELILMADVQLPFFSPFGGRSGFLVDNSQSSVQYDADAPTWVLFHLVLPAVFEHLAALPSLEQVTPENAGKFATDVLDVATAKDLTYRAEVPLAGLDLLTDTAVSLSDDVTIRHLSESEQGDIVEEWGIGSTTSPFFAVPRCVLDVRCSIPRNGQNPDMRPLVDKWLIALQLHGYCLAGKTAKTQTYPSWLLAATGYAPLAISQRTPKWSVIDSAAAASIQKTAQQLAGYDVSNPNSEHDLALHRYYLGLSRSNDADSVLDFVIALESLLLPYDEQARHGDLSYRFRIHGAHFLAEESSERRAIAKSLTDLYGLRSRLVHGGKYPSATDIRAGRELAESLARRGLHRAVLEGFPTAVGLKDLALGL